MSAVTSTRCDTLSTFPEHRNPTNPPNQPGRKLRRRNARHVKAVAIAPRPVDKLRPVVRCPGIKYNRRVRAGRGFSLAELKVPIPQQARRKASSHLVKPLLTLRSQQQEAGIPRKLAPTSGISVDPRRANHSAEGRPANLDRLNAYRARLILFPRKSGQHKTLDASKEEVQAAEEEHGKIIKNLGKVLPIENISKEEAVGEVDRDDIGEGTEDAYATLRKARSDARLVGVREKRAKAKAEDAQAAKK